MILSLSLGYWCFWFYDWLLTYAIASFDTMLQFIDKFFFAPFCIRKYHAKSHCKKWLIKNEMKFIFCSISQSARYTILCMNVRYAVLSCSVFLQSTEEKNLKITFLKVFMCSINYMVKKRTKVNWPWRLHYFEFFTSD